MKGQPEIIKHLNIILRNELTAISQYFLHSRMLLDWGLKKLGDFEFQESVDEMKHADKIISRILFLEGLPNLQDLDKLRIGEDVREILQGDLIVEEKARADLQTAIKDCENLQDYTTRGMLQSILNGEELHIDFLETQLQLIERVGIQNYQQSQMEPGEG